MCKSVVRGFKYAYFVILLKTTVGFLVRGLNIGYDNECTYVYFEIVLKELYMYVCRL